MIGPTEMISSTTAIEEPPRIQSIGKKFVAGKGASEGAAAFVNNAG